MKYYRLIALLLLMVSGPLYAQKKVIGLVCDEQNTPLIGATVMVKGTQNGTIADVDGTYSLKVKEGDVLEITFGEKTLRVRVADVKEHAAKADAAAMYEVLD